MNPPVVPADRLDGWERVETTTERPFAAGPVSVTASTARYERATRPDPRPFFFASRLQIRPSGSASRALTRLVTQRAQSGFCERLADRGITDVDRRQKRSLSVDDPEATRATLITYRGQASLAQPVAVEAILAVWRADAYLLAGGGYPLDTAPEAARRELLGLVRGVHTA